MVIKDNIKGLLYGIGSLILIGIQPIIANSRPSEIDAYLFAMMTVIYQALIFLPLLILERKSLHNIIENSENIIIIKQLKGWRKHKKLIIYLGINFN